MRIAVAGGTGLSGQAVVGALTARGDEVVVLARSTGADVLTGSGLADKLDGVEAVIDVTNVKTTKGRESVAFFEQASANLLAAEADAGVRHHISLSIIGCDRVDLGYYLGKRRQDEIVQAGGVPFTILRATQFHEFASQMLSGTGRFVLAPKMRSQPVALSEVAERLAELAHSAPLNGITELAGPQPDLMIDEMVTRLAAKRGDRRFKLRVAIPGKVGRQIKAGGLLPSPQAKLGTITFDEWLANAS